MKYCYKCKETKDLSCFGKDKSTKDGFNNKCRSCSSICSKKQYASDPNNRLKKKEAAVRWRGSNPERAKEISKRHYRNNIPKKRNLQLRYLYGITLEDYNRLLVEQSDCCKICGRNRSSLKKPLCVDHCHVTGKVRGLLCHSCNRVLGLLQDSIDRCNKVIDYLKDSTPS